MAMIDRNFTFATNGTVTANDLHNLIDSATIYQNLITGQQPITSVGTNYELLIADGTNPNAAPNAVTVYDLFEDALTAGTYTNANISEALSYGTATGTRLVSTNATITTGTITTAVIPTLTSSTATFGTTTSTAATITNLASTTGTIATLNSTTGTIATLNSTTGTIATLNSTTGTIGTLNSTTGTIVTLNSTTGTIPTLVATTLITTGTGTAASPAIQPTGDTNTGIFFPAADTLAATTNGTERLRIASDGQIGIGGANYGTSGQVLTSGGASAAPSWQTAGGITRATAVASTSGTAIAFTGIPSSVKRITVMFSGVSTTGASVPKIRLGTSSGPETSNYFGVVSNNDVAYSALSNGFDLVQTGGATVVFYGQMTLSCLSGNTWTCFSSVGRTDNTFFGTCSGGKTLADTLDRIVFTTASTTETFDGGSINIMYES